MQPVCNNIITLLFHCGLQRNREMWQVEWFYVWCVGRRTSHVWQQNYRDK